MLGRDKILKFIEYGQIGTLFKTSKEEEQEGKEMQIGIFQDSTLYILIDQDIKGKNFLLSLEPALKS